MPNPPNRLNAIRTVQGSTKKFLVRVRTHEGRPVQLTDAVVRLSVRRLAGTEIVIAKVSSDDTSGIKITDQSKGEITITLSTVDTELLEPGTHRYDVWIEFPVRTPPERYPVVQ